MFNFFKKNFFFSIAILLCSFGIAIFISLPAQSANIIDGDLIRNPDAEGMAQFDIYIVKLVSDKKFKRLILSPHVFESYAHFDKNGNGSPWDDVLDVNQSIIDEYTLSDLVRADGDTKAYRLIAHGDVGIRQSNIGTFYNYDSVYIVNAIDLNSYVVEEESTVEFTKEQPKTATFQWEYRDVSYNISITLYDSVYNYYNSQPKEYVYFEGYLPDNWKEDFFKMFLNVSEADDTFSQIALKINSIGKARGLTDDQIAELAVAFVQSIPYDEAKLKMVEILPRYPYEVLYDNKGICSGKTFLAALLVEELGYGIALFDFDTEEHIALGIKCPINYSSYNSGYCYAEPTTEGHLIGYIPELDKDTGQAILQKSAEEETKLSTPDIYKVTSGKKYIAIENTINIINQIESLDKEIGSMESKLESIENQLADYEQKLNDAETSIEYNLWDSQYQKKYNEYSNLYSEYEQKIKEYNNLIEIIFI